MYVLDRRLDFASATLTDYISFFFEGHYISFHTNEKSLSSDLNLATLCTPFNIHY
jgi:hypothetical protein